MTRTIRHSRRPHARTYSSGSGACMPPPLLPCRPAVAHRITTPTRARQCAAATLPAPRSPRPRPCTHRGPSVDLADARTAPRPSVRASRPRARPHVDVARARPSGPPNYLPVCASAACPASLALAPGLKRARASTWPMGSASVVVAPPAPPPSGPPELSPGRPRQRRVPKPLAWSAPERMCVCSRVGHEPPCPWRSSATSERMITLVTVHAWAPLTLGRSSAGAVSVIGCGVAL